MKSLFITLGVLCFAVIAAAVIYSNLHNVAPVPQPTEAQPPAAAEESPAPKPSSLRSVSNLAVRSNEHSVPAFAARRTNANSFGDPAADALKQSVASFSFHAILLSANDRRC